MAPTVANAREARNRFPTGGGGRGASHGRAARGTPGGPREAPFRAIGPARGCYRGAMVTVRAPVPPPPRQAFTWRRLRTTGITCLVVSLLMLPGWEASYAVLIGRLALIGAIVLGAFVLAERWPARLPGWLERWALQVIAVAVAVPVAVFLVYTVTTWGDQPHWWLNEKRRTGFFLMTVFGLLASPWIAVSALFGQIRNEARSQALAFELERSELERKALDARLTLLQARVEPHFLFNTLANVRELVVTGSPEAATVLDSLIAYLRAAVPRLHETAATVAQEVELARAYLEVMHMRMPDRLRFAIDADPRAADLWLPPMALLTLVENAVRHGIDPCEDGGRIDVAVSVTGERCLARVADTGRGLAPGAPGLGTGLAQLRERLLLAFGGEARLELRARDPHGAVAEIEFPARKAAP